MFQMMQRPYFRICLSYTSSTVQIKWDIHKWNGSKLSVRLKLQFASDFSAILTILKCGRHLENLRHMYTSRSRAIRVHVG